MKLLDFQRPSGEWVYLNPQLIAGVEPNANGNCFILINGGFIEVKLSKDAAIEKIENAR